MIENNTEIKGITICQKEYKLTQFADDTSLFLEGSQKSLQTALNTLEIFGNISGLRMNTEKTRVIWNGRNFFTKDKINTTPMLNWGDTQFELLGLTFTADLVNIIEINYNKYIPQIKNMISHWNRRYLTPLGKIVVIKTFLLSKLIHVFVTLQNPTDDIIKKRNKIRPVLMRILLYIFFL